MKTRAEQEPPRIPGMGRGKERNALCPCKSGKKFNECHGAPPVPETPTVPPPTLAGPPPLKLDLGCGTHCKEGFSGVDLHWDKADHKVDLFKFPWPWADDSIAEINASHLIEHIPAREIEERDLQLADMILRQEADAIRTRFLGQDMLFAFFDECWRMLKKDAMMTVVCPSARNSRAFWDPTHRRFIEQITFMYLNRDWRKQNGLDHYKVRCNFAGDVGYSHESEEAVITPERAKDRFQHFWNVTIDWYAKLRVEKP